MTIPLKMICFMYLDSKKYRKRLDQNGAESIPIGITIFCLKTREKAFIYEEKHNIDKTLTYEVYSSIYLRSPIDKSFRKSMYFLTLDLNAKLITSESTLRSLGWLHIRC